MLRGYMHAMQIRAAPPPQVRDSAHGLLQATVSVRWIPLVPAPLGTRVARLARTTTLPPGGDDSQLDRRVRPVLGEPLLVGKSRRARGSYGLAFLKARL